MLARNPAQGKYEHFSAPRRGRKEKRPSAHQKENVHRTDGRLSYYTHYTT